MRDALALGEGDEAVSWTIGLDAHDRGAEFFRKGDVLLKRVAIRLPDVPRSLARRLDIDGVPAGAETSGDAGTGANHPRRVSARAHADHHTLWNERGLQPLALPP